MTKVRTRFAPSPTGYLHLGGLRTALYAYLYARTSGGDFLLRIEDTDLARFVPGTIEIIYDGLRKCGINWDEGPDVGGSFGPYIQSERKDSYLPYAAELVKKGAAYYCFCTKEELDARRNASGDPSGYKYDKHCAGLSDDEVQKRLDRGDAYVIRQNIPAEGEAAFDDILYGRITVDCALLDDGVLIKSDGMPTYNFANVIDDHLMQITHVIRGNEYLSSTPKYNLMYDAFGWEKPVYIHVNQIMRDATHKFSKRDGDASLEDFLAKGFLPEAIINYVAFLGWNPGDNREIFTMDELIKAFSIENLSKSPALFDINKLLWYNSEYIRAMDGDRFASVAEKWLRDEGFPVDRFDMGMIFALLKTRADTFKGMGEKFDFLLERFDVDSALYTHKKMKTDIDVARTALSACNDALAGLDVWSFDSITECLAAVVEETGLKNGQILWPLRIAITGKAATPGGASEAAYLLGKAETLSRLNSEIKRLMP